MFRNSRAPARASHIAQETWWGTNRWANRPPSLHRCQQEWSFLFSVGLCWSLHCHQVGLPPFDLDSKTPQAGNAEHPLPFGNVFQTQRIYRVPSSSPVRSQDSYHRCLGEMMANGGSNFRHEGRTPSPRCAASRRGCGERCALGVGSANPLNRYVHSGLKKTSQLIPPPL